MKIICSYCRKYLGKKEPFDYKETTHSVCPSCFEHFEKQWQGLRLGEYLDQWDKPVAAIDGEGRFVAANQAMAEMLGKDRRDMWGLLGGEVMECVYARLEEGCGETVHCRDCTIRNTVTSTFESGTSNIKVPAFLDTQDQKIGFLISTSIEKGFVRLVIEDVLDSD